MALSIVTLEGAAERLAGLAGGGADSEGTLSELLRAEVHARKHAPRAATLARVTKLLASAVTLDEDRLEEVCRALELVGDVVLAPGGVLYATPTRVVILETHARVFGSIPTRALAAALGRDVSVVGLTRTLAKTGGLAELVAQIEGALVTPEVWAGLDRAPNADAGLLAKLDHRLEWEASGAGSLEKDGALDWRAWEATSTTASWRRSNEGRLWWARTQFGGHRRAWTAGASPAKSVFVGLSADDTDRARFAICRAAGGGSVLTVDRSANESVIVLPSWLPRAEYRWLSLRAELLPETKGLRWKVTSDQEAAITTQLVERLGLVVEVR